MKLTKKAAIANLRTLGLEMISLKRTGKGYRALNFTDADRELYAESLAFVDSELSAYDHMVNAVGKAHAGLGEVLRTWFGDE